MKQPSLDVLMHNVDSKYTLVVAAAKRARLIMANTAPDDINKDVKPVSRALKEIADGKVNMDYNREGTK